MDVDYKPCFQLVHGSIKLILLIKLSIFSYLNGMLIYIGMFYTCIYVVSNSIIVSDLMCRVWFTHKGPVHRFLDELSLLFTILDGSDTPPVGL